MGEQRMSPSKALLALETNPAVTTMWLEKAWPDETENSLLSEEERAGIPQWLLPPRQGKPRNTGAGGSMGSSSSGAVP